jgi:Vacuolar protein sorting-associated protein 62
VTLHQGSGGSRIRHVIERIAELGGLGMAVFLVGAVVGGGIVFLVERAHAPTIKTVRQVRAFSEVQEPRAGALADRFRPWLLFDGKERWRPLNVDRLLDEGTHSFCTVSAGRTTCQRITGAAGFDGLLKQSPLGVASDINLGSGGFRDYHGPVPCGGVLLDCGTGARSAIYYHVTQSNDRYYIDYWFFYRFNHFARSDPSVSCKSQIARVNDICDEHQGDWEGVTAVTQPDDPTRLDYVVYAAHKGTFRYSASQLRLVDGTRPVVYVANGSHASYPRPCASSCSQPPGLAQLGLVDLPEGAFDGRASWAHNGDACPANQPGSCLTSLSQQPWVSWAGQWGAGCGGACGGAADANSPASPGRQARYLTPWCSSANGIFTCDGTAVASCGDWLGPLVAVVACDDRLLETGLNRSDKTAPGRLAIVLSNGTTLSAHTPGVVQSLGDPLTPPATFTVVADGPATQILVRAEQGDATVEDQFDEPSAALGQRIRVQVSPGGTGPAVTADGRGPDEERIVKTSPATAQG